MENDSNVILRLGILLSGRGSNFLAIAESIRAGRLPGTEIAVVISNVADAAGSARAREMGLPTTVLVSSGRKREEHDADVIACLHENTSTSSAWPVTCGCFRRNS